VSVKAAMSMSGVGWRVSSPKEEGEGWRYLGERREQTHRQEEKEGFKEGGVV
jgi:hypothetical protein